MRQIASILALVTLFACANIFPVKVRFNFKTDAGEGWEIPANLLDTKILLFPSRILDLFSCEMWNCAIPYWVGIKRKSKKNTVIYKNYSNYFYRKLLVFHIFKLLVLKACEYFTTTRFLKLILCLWHQVSTLLLYLQWDPYVQVSDGCALRNLSLLATAVRFEIFKIYV